MASAQDDGTFERWLEGLTRDVDALKSSRGPVSIGAFVLMVDGGGRLTATNTDTGTSTVVAT